MFHFLRTVNFGLVLCGSVFKFKVILVILFCKSLEKKKKIKEEEEEKEGLINNNTQVPVKCKQGWV